MIGKLAVLEFDGTARAGKGSIARELAKLDGFTTAETGILYRTVTKNLLLDNIVKPEMTPAEVSAAVDTVDDTTLAKYVASRDMLIDTHGGDSLYEEDVNMTVHRVGPIPRVRKHVKAQFTQEVADAVASNSIRFLAVDGRRLTQVIEAVDGAELELRMFVTCTAEEAARRELERGLIGEEQLQGTIDAIAARNHEDMTRDLDPVKPDDNSIDYWTSGEPIKDSPLRSGVGTLARQENRQILLDTTNSRDVFPDDPKGGMIKLVRAVIDEIVQL